MASGAWETSINFCLDLSSVIDSMFLKQQFLLVRGSTSIVVSLLSSKQENSMFPNNFHLDML